MNHSSKEEPTTEMVGNEVSGECNGMKHVESFIVTAGGNYMIHINESLSDGSACHGDGPAKIIIIPQDKKMNEVNEVDKNECHLKEHERLQETIFEFAHSYQWSIEEIKINLQATLNVIDSILVFPSPEFIRK
jgi:hypothetical protein